MDVAKYLVLALLVAAELVAGGGMDGEPRKDIPFSPADQRIDNLGKESSIKSIQDVDTYINAIIERFRPELSSRFGDISLSPQFDEIRSRVAAAEYRAVGNHSARIPEKLIASVFNDVMNTWNEPAWTRISVEELHAYRTLVAKIRYPASVARDDEGNLSDSCRPVEAVLLLYRLERNRGVSTGLRQLVESGNFDYAAGQQVSPGPLNTRLVPGSHAGDDIRRDAEANRAAALEREREYVSARDAFFSAHPNIDPVDHIEHILDLLHIN